MKTYPITLQPDGEVHWDIAPGALRQISNFVPLQRGSYATFAPHVSANKVADYDATVYPVAGGIVRLPNDSVRAFMFNKRSIYELLSTSAATNRSAATYSASTDTWTWTMFGDTCIATNKQDSVQASSSGAFAALSGSPPKAKLVVSQLGFVMLLNYDDGTDTPDGWWCSQIENPTGSWATSLSTQAANGRLYDTPGPITAAVALRDSVIAFKADSIYVGDYIGDTANGIIWGWRLVSDKVGCAAAHGVALVNDRLYFIHRTNVYEFDGAALRPIGDAIAHTLLRSLTATSIDGLNSVQAVVDQTNAVIIWAFDATGGDLLGECIAYNIASGKFSQCAPLATDSSGTSGTDFYATAVVKSTQSDLVKFLGVASDYTTTLFTGKTSASKSGIWYATYPGGAAAYYGGAVATVIVGIVGGDGVRVSRVLPRFRVFDGDDQDIDPVCTIVGSKSEADIVSGAALHIQSASWNAEEFCFDGTLQDRYVTVAMSFGGPVELSGIGLDAVASAKR